MEASSFWCRRPNLLWISFLSLAVNSIRLCHEGQFHILVLVCYPLAPLFCLPLVCLGQSVRVNSGTFWLAGFPGVDSCHVQQLAVSLSSCSC